MASEFYIDYPTGSTLVATLTTGASLVNASTGALISDTAANFATASISMSDATRNGRYKGSVPSALVAGVYALDIYSGTTKVGGPVTIHWTGTAILALGVVLPNNAVAGGLGALPMNGSDWRPANLIVDDTFTVSGANPDVNVASIANNAITAAAIAADAAVEIASALSGTGARTVTITVNDGSTAIENAIVRMTEGANSYTSSTNASGVCTFNLDDATYTVSISKAGYSYSGTTLVVNGTETAAYSMTAVSVSAPSAPSLTTAYLTTYNGQGAVEGSVVISFKLEDGVGTSGYSYNQKTFTATSNASTGLLEVELVKSTQYSARRGNGEWVDFTTGSGSTYALPEVLGTP